MPGISPSPTAVPSDRCALERALGESDTAAVCIVPRVEGESLGERPPQATDLPVDGAVRR